MTADFPTIVDGDSIIMLRCHMNENDTFAASVEYALQDSETAIDHKREKNHRSWAAIDEGWQELNGAMIKCGIEKAVDHGERMVWLNIGGSIFSLHRSVLDGMQRLPSVPWTLADLFQAQWDSRMPQDSDSLIVIDESPACVKHLLNALKASHGLGGELQEDEKAYLPHVSRALGLSSPIQASASRAGMVVTGGSTILDTDVGPLSKTIQAWFPDKPDELKLLFRMSRDTSDPSAFHARCGDDSPSTITLFQVGIGDSASVVGGFSSTSWAPRSSLQPEYRPSPGAFVFMLKNNPGSGGTSFQPTRWRVKQQQAEHAIQSSSSSLPYFGPGDLRYSVVLWTGNTTYDIPADTSAGAAFLGLNGQAVTDIEVFRVCAGASGTMPSFRSTLLDISTADPAPTTAGEDSHDARRFGFRIAESLSEERAALSHARTELTKAGLVAAASANALLALYGPDIAAGKEDDVVELSVRGTRFTTLRSTLQACPDSVFSLEFSREGPPGIEVGEQGQRCVDCKPCVFSKLLDVLRMRKRLVWTGGPTAPDGSPATRVRIKAIDRAPFEAFVKEKFSGYEKFIWDCVEAA